MTVLLLRLAGPLQAWGSAARFARRSTENAPTKSGVLGLLAAAEGRPFDADLADLAALRYGVRIDQPGRRVRDFQTAHHADSDRAMPISHRFYLADAVFVAGLEGDAALLHRLHAALLAPHYLPYLGRRSCPPSRPVDLGPPLDGTLEEALRTTGWQASTWYAARHRHVPPPLETLIDCAPGEDPDLSLRDIPVSFDPRHRRYALRAVRIDRVTTPPRADARRPAEHDPCAGLLPAPAANPARTH
jgi:CRISPR system Cascade subunit CasD